MEGTIRIEGYHVDCIIGVYPHEREREQEVIFDIELRVDMTEAIQSDHLTHAVDYDRVVAVCHALATQGEYHLLERLVFMMLQEIQGIFSPLWVRVRAKKSRAIPCAEAASVEMELFS
ncbi:MAG: dihydroneopterin aldolase [Chlamydiia bacterium]|nr:dihydroneopterin aldolase [Chlamydiia bacterium]